MTDTSESKDKKPKWGDTYMGKLVLSRDKEGMKKYNKYAKEHAARLRRLEREASVEQLPPEDYY